MQEILTKLSYSNGFLKEHIYNKKCLAIFLFICFHTVLLATINHLQRHNHIYYCVSLSCSGTNRTLLPIYFHSYTLFSISPIKCSLILALLLFQIVSLNGEAKFAVTFSYNTFHGKVLFRISTNELTVQDFSGIKILKQLNYQPITNHLMENPSDENMKYFQCSLFLVVGRFSIESYFMIHRYA